MASMLWMLMGLLSACSVGQAQLVGVTGPSTLATWDTSTPLTDAEAASVTDSDWQTPQNKQAAKRQARLLRLALKQASKKNGKVSLNKVAERWFNDYSRTHQKTYSPLEEQNAKQAWLDNIAAIIKTNEDDSSSSWAGLHEYSDMSPAEMTDKMMMKNKPQRGNPKRISPMDDPASAELARMKAARMGQGAGGTSRKLLQTLTYPTDDWRNFVRMTVRNQGLCGSCWAIAATSSVETIYRYTRSSTLQLSPQQLIDCENPRTGFYSQGCLGGYSDAAFEYIWSINQTSEGRYPYQGEFGSVCGATSTRIPQGSAIKLAGAEPTVYPIQNSPLDLANAEYVAPTVVYLHASPAFMAYRGGVFNPSATDCNPDLVNHAVLVMGYNYTGNWATSYFIIQNSWGTTWGENGYMRIAMWPPGPGPCGMYQFPMYPSVAGFAQAMAAPPPPPSPPAPPPPRPPSPLLPPS